MSDHRFLDLPSLLRPGDLVVVNETRVRAARLEGHRGDTGGGIELLVLEARPDGLWEALVRPSRRLRPGVEIVMEGISASVVEGPEEGLVVVDIKAADVEAAIAAAGTIPLPPYFHGTLDYPDRYQTMFARNTGSAAAPRPVSISPPRWRPVSGSGESRSPRWTSMLESTHFDPSPPTRSSIT